MGTSIGRRLPIRMTRRNTFRIGTSLIHGKLLSFFLILHAHLKPLLGAKCKGSLLQAKSTTSASPTSASTTSRNCLRTLHARQSPPSTKSSFTPTTRAPSSYSIARRRVSIAQATAVSEAQIVRCTRILPY